MRKIKSFVILLSACAIYISCTHKAHYQEEQLESCTSLYAQVINAVAQHDSISSALIKKQLVGFPVDTNQHQPPAPLCFSVSEILDRFKSNNDVKQDSLAVIRQFENFRNTNTIIALKAKTYQKYTQAYSFYFWVPVFSANERYAIIQYGINEKNKRSDKFKRIVLRHDDNQWIIIRDEQYNLVQ
ncbi:MAG: hypothetical protein Q8861_13560 [Bacteroidota bacterium]|nr:hypothetical protein [Bacteroidota bacterium]